MNQLKIFITFVLFVFGSNAFCADALSKHTNVREFTDLLVYDRKCPGIKFVENELKTYRELLTSPNSSAQAVSRKAEELKNWIAQVAKTKDRCRRSVLSYYLVESVHLLTSEIADIPSQDSAVKRLPLSAGWTYYTVVALNQNHVAFTDGSQLKVVEQSHNASYGIVGSYRCETLSVLLNPAQAPLNLASTMSHELFHFFFDRASGYNIYVSDVLKGSTFSVLLEETLASLLGAYLQHEFNDQVLAPQLRSESLADLNFFSKDGALNRIVSSIRDNAEQFKSRYDQMIFATFFMERDRNTWKHCRPDPKTGRWTVCETRHYYSENLPTDRLLNLVASAYFGRSLNGREQRGLSRDEILKTIDSSNYPIGYIIADDFSPGSRWLNWWSKASPSALFQLSRPDFPFFEIIPRSDPTSGLSAGADGLPSPFLSDWREHPEDQHFGPSRVCRQFHSLVNSGKIRGYVGGSSQDESSRPSGGDGVKPTGGDGVKPTGGDGVKPSGGDGVKPTGGDGVKPTGGDGVKPTGGDGVKPSGPIRPCINMDIKP